MRRPRLFDTLDAGRERRLVLISAPAGAGKTALLSTWLAERRRRRVAWMSLRPRRGESAFWAAFLEALRHVAPETAGLSRLAAPRAGTPSSFVDRLLNVVAQLRSPVTVVIDDFHNLPGGGVADGIEQLLRAPTPRLRFVISTRHDPNLPVHLFRANGEVVELRAADLAFTADETREFLGALDLELHPVLLKALLERTEGWAAGLRLFTLSLRGGTAAGVDALLDDTAAVDYLVQEALRHQPDETRRFLLQTSIVDRLTPDLAEALTGMESSGMLEELVNQNLFIERVGSSPTWYRYHHLFAELLRMEMLQDAPAEIPELHARAARWYLANGEHVDAVQHAFAAGELDLASTCLVESWFDLLVEADLTVQMALMDALPSERIANSVPLTAVAATLAFINGDVRRGASWLDALGSVDVRELDLRVQGIFTFACLLRHRLDGKCSQAADLAETLLELSEAGFLPGRTADRIKTLAVGFLGVCELWLERDDAQAHLHEALHLARATDVSRIEILSLGGLAMLELGRGRLRRAARLAGRAADVAESGGLDRTPHATLAYAVLALVEYEWNDLDAAESNARLLAAVARLSGDRVARALSAYVDGCLCLARGDGDVELGIQRLKGVASDWGAVDALSLRAASASAYARLVAATGDDSAAKEILEQAQVDAPAASEVALGLARLRLTDGEPESALALLSVDGGGDASAASIECSVLAAIAYRALGQTEESRTAFGRALALGEGESIRRPLLDAGPSLRELLSDHLRHSASHRWFASDLLSALNGNDARGSAPAELLEPLTARETDVLRYLPTMMSNADIAGELFVSVNTIKSHVKSIYRKLGATQRRDAVHRARQLHLL
jgi:LuxR family transcriptional regulator, maltose regulon positive regulatory protein